MELKNIHWINMLKALCIIFVFLSHCESYYGLRLGWFDAIYLPFYVNSFFFVSGYLLFWKQLSEPKICEKRHEFIQGGSGWLLFKNIIFRIVIPSIIFASLEFFPKKLIKGESFDMDALFYDTLGGLTYWFTSALVVAEILILLLLLTRIRTIWFYLFTCLLLTCLGKMMADLNICLIDCHRSFPWQWKHGMVCTIYMATGGLYWKYESVLRKYFNLWVVLTMICLYCFLSLYFFHCLYNGYMTSMLMIHPLGALHSIASSILLIELCRRLPETKPLTFIGQHSIGFYFLCGALPMTFGFACRRFLPFSPNIAILLLIWIITLVLAYIIVQVLNHYAPWVFDLRRYGKNKNE